MKISRGASIDRYYLLKLFGFGIFLHKIHHSDPQDLYHSHPWSGLSLILGSYIEVRHAKPPKRKYFFNWISAKTHHRVIVERPIWTLFIHLPKSNRWSIINETGHVISEAPWEGDAGYKDYSKVQINPSSSESNHAGNHVSTPSKEDQN